ncbi:MAG: hypothetical protein ACOX4F_09445 [Atopobiaceae bacterium]|jgi:hypothetical protein
MDTTDQHAQHSQHAQHAPQDKKSQAPQATPLGASSSTRALVHVEVGVDPEAKLVDAAYAQAIDARGYLLLPAETSDVEGTADAGSAAAEYVISLLLTPHVPMGALEALAPLASMGILDACAHAGVAQGVLGISWPAGVVRQAGHEPFARITTTAGYAAGMFVALSVRMDAAAAQEVFSPAPWQDDSFAEDLIACIETCVSSWEDACINKGYARAPWAPFLPEYFDCVALMGKPVDVRYPNGRVYARGHFVGIDIWGRATVRTKRAGDIEFAAERFSIAPQSEPAASGGDDAPDGANAPEVSAS